MNNYCNNYNNYVYHPDLNELQTFKKKKYGDLTLTKENKSKCVKDFRI